MATGGPSPPAAAVPEGGGPKPGVRLPLAAAAAPDAAYDRVEMSGRRGGRHALAEPAEHEQDADRLERVDLVVRRGVREDRDDGNPEIGAAREIEGGGHHADDDHRRSGRAVDEAQRLADDRGIGVEMRAPQLVTDDHRRRRIRHVVRGAEEASRASAARRASGRSPRRRRSRTA